MNTSTPSCQVIVIETIHQTLLTSQPIYIAFNQNENGMTPGKHKVPTVWHTIPESHIGVMAQMHGSS
jgi:hypothetical protein